MPRRPVDSPRGTTRRGEIRSPVAASGQTRTPSTRGCSPIARAATSGTSLAERRITLLVTREYEHLLVALHAGRRGPAVSWLPLPHPSGIAVDPARGVVHVASTRNPNQLFDLAPVTGLIGTRDRARRVAGRPLVPVRSRFLPGCLYLHDLAMVGGALHANAGGAERRRSASRPTAAGRASGGRDAIETGRRPALRSQLPAAQLDRRRADAGERRSSRRPRPRQVARRPGHRNFPVDRRGVIFSGAHPRGRSCAGSRGRTPPACTAGSSGWTTAATARSGSCVDGALRARRRAARLDARPRLPRRPRVRRHVARPAALPPLRAGPRPRRAASAASTSSTPARGTLLGEPASGRPATRSSRSSPCRLASRPGFPSPPRARHTTEATRALFSGFVTHTGKDAR